MWNYWKCSKPSPISGLSRQKISWKPQAFFNRHDFGHNLLKPLGNHIDFRLSKRLKQLNEFILVIIVSELQYPSVIWQQSERHLFILLINMHFYYCPLFIVLVFKVNLDG